MSHQGPHTPEHAGQIGIQVKSEVKRYSRTTLEATNVPRAGSVLVSRIALHLLRIPLQRFPVHQ